MTRDEIIELLQAGEHVVTFTKVDGTIREMPCTLNADTIPPAPIKEGTVKERKENLTVLRVFCTDIKEWRSFRVDSVISITEVIYADPLRK